MNPTRPAKATFAAVDADAWFTPGRFAFILAALIIASFPGVVAGLETFFYRDFANFSYPLAFHYRESFWRGAMPLWNPLNNCGVPFLAQWNTMTLYPPSLFYLLLPLQWSLPVFCLLHLFLGGMGMYFLAHRWTGSRLAAAIAGTVFAFNGLTWTCLIWLNYSATIGWLPWVILMAEQAWREGGRRIIPAALTGAMQMLAGGPEVIMLTWSLAGAFWLAAFLGGEIPRRRLILRFAGVPLLVTALAAVQLLPFLQFVAHSQRDNSFGDSQWAMAATGWANYLVPLFHFRPGAQGVFLQYDQYCFASYYLGVGTIALALLALWRVRRREVWVLSAVAAFGVLLAMGDHGHVYSWIRRVAPQMGFMRFPVKFVVIPTFAIPILAAYGAAWLQALPADKWAAQRKTLPLLGLAVLTLLAAIAWAEWKHPKPLDDVPFTLKNALGRAGFLVAILGCLHSLRTATSAKLQRFLQVGVVMLFWCDVLTHAPSPSPTVDPKVYDPDAIRAYLKWDAHQFRAGESRTMQTPGSVLKILFGSVTNAVDTVYGQRLSQFADANLLDHAAKVDGFFALYPREANELYIYLYTLTNGLAPLKDFMGVSFISDATHTMDWVRRDTAMPLLTAGQEPLFADGPSTFRAVTSDGFEPRKYVYLPLEAKSAINAGPQPETKIVSHQFAAQQVTAEVEAAAPAMLVVAQSWYAPWRAYVDGQPAKLWKANYAFQSVEVPAGHHSVRLVYEDRAFRCGIVLSLVALAFCAVAWRRSGQVPSQSLTQAHFLAGAGGSVDGIHDLLELE